MDDFAPLDGAGSGPAPRSSVGAGDWKSIVPVPDNAAAPPEAHLKRGKPSARWAYLDKEGRTLMWIYRFDGQNGGKDILPATYCQRKGERTWRWKGLPPPRPIYGLDRLTARPETPVIIAEGEKAADAAAELFPDHVAVTWPNGSKAVGKADWSPLRGRDVVLWPDADTPGREAMIAVARQLTKVKANAVRLVEPPADVAKSWDAADAKGEIEAGTRKLDSVVSLIAGAKPWAVTVNDESSATTSDQGGGPSKRPNPGNLLESVGALELWHTPSGEAWATVWNEKGFANYALDDRRFETWLVYKLLSASHDVPSREVIGKMLADLRSRAIFDGEEHNVFVRVAGSLSTAVFIDLGRPDWRALKLNPSNWEVVDCPAVKFRRGSGMRALPIPDENGSIDDLRNWINCQTEEDWKLLLAWITSAMRPDGPFPLLLLTGPPGAAKSTTAKIVRSLIDPSGVPLSRIPKDPRDLGAAILNSWVLCYDNISKVPMWLSDDLCMIATGEGIRERQLHTNAGEVLIEGGRPIILNGIGDLATRSDLADRSVLVSLDPPAQRLAEYLDVGENKAIWPAFDAALPGLLGGLCGVFCAAMRHLHDARDLPSGSPRMVDFAIWANAVGEAMGWEPGTFDDVYNRNRSEADEVALENCPIWEPLQVVFRAGRAEWKGSATDLKNEILAVIDTMEMRKKFISMQPSTVAQHLQRIMPLLNKNGWRISKTRTGQKGRLWNITPPAEPN